MNKELLKKAIDDRCINVSSLAHKMGISRVSVYNYLNGTTEPRAAQMQKLIEAIRLSQEETFEIFFASKVESNSTKDY